MSQARLQVDADGVLQLAGELDFVSAPLLREQLLAAVESGQGPLVLDFAQVTQANSVALSLLLRAAELTVQEGFDWFATVERATDRDTRYVGGRDPFYDPYYRGWNPYWRFYRGGRSSRFDPCRNDINVRQIDRFEATSEIIMGRGPKPAGDPNAFDARDVIANIAPRVTR